MSVHSTAYVLHFMRDAISSCGLDKSKHFGNVNISKMLP